MPWYIPLLIFLARLTDVPIGTLRIIFVVRGAPVVAAILGFFEVSIWVLGVSGVLKYLFDNPLAILGYAGGFAVGNLVGLWIERKLALGQLAVRIINTRKDIRLTPLLREAGYGVTEVGATGKDGPVELCFLVIPRAVVLKLEKFVLGLVPGAFMSVENVRGTIGGIYQRLPSERFSWLKLIKFK